MLCVDTVTKKIKKCEKRPFSRRCKVAKRKMSGKAKCCKWVTVRDQDDDDDDDDDPALPE